MTTKKPETEQPILPIAITAAVAIALTGVAVVVSANTQAPTHSASEFFTPDANYSAFHNELHAAKLKQNALNKLRGLPDHDSTSQAAGRSTGYEQIRFDMSAPASGVSSTVTETEVNVNTFLLSQRMSNESRLAELQMQPFFSDFDSKLFAASSIESERPASIGFDGVGFPHIETNERADVQRYKPYRELVSFSSDENGVIVPNVRCMGLSPVQVADRAKKYDAKIFELSVKHRVSVSLVKAVVTKESCFNAAARSHVGAIGLMQLMPETAKWLKVKQPENANQNLAAGIRYLAQLRKRFGSNELALAAYNAGPGNVERYNGIPPFAETQNYVQDVLHFYRGYVATTRFVNALNDFE